MAKTLSCIVSKPSECQSRASAYAVIVDDNLFRDLEQAETMDLSTLKRSEAITRRAVKSKWFYALTGWVNEINGGPGKMGPSPSEKIMIEGKEDASMSSRKPA